MNRHILLALLLAVTAVAWLPEGAPVWKRIGPGGGGAQFLPAVSPHDSKRAAVTCDMSGSYVTEDGGESWRIFNLHDGARFFAFDPRDPATLYVSAVGLHRSTDFGRTWTMLYPDPAAVASVNMETDDADESFVMRAGSAGTVTALVVDPTDSRTLFAGIDDSVRVSTDAGKTWKVEQRLPWPARSIFIDGARNLYVGGPDRIASRRKGQWTISAAPAGIGEFHWVTAAPPVFYATASRKGTNADALLRSIDGGATWQDYTRKLPTAAFHLPMVAASDFHSETVYLTADNRLLRSRDYGETWSQVLTDTQRPINYPDDWVNELHSGWGGGPHGIGVSPRDPKVVYVTDDGRTLRTTDGGETWNAVYSRRLASGGSASRGLDVTTCYGVHFDPFHAKRMFITNTDIGLFRSDDGGTSWVPSMSGVPRQWTNTAYWMVFDPQVAGRAWMAVSDTHDLPRPRTWRHQSPLKFHGGVVTSTDGGLTWRNLDRGFPDGGTAVTHLLLDQRSPAASRTLYAAAMGRGVYKSVDGGQSWTLRNAGITEREPLAWRLSQDAAGTLYLVVARRREDGKSGGEGDGAVYRSTDGAMHWTPLPLPVNGPTGITPIGARLLLSSWESAPGIHYSDDAGKSWTAAAIPDDYIYDITTDSREPNVAYATGFSNAAWRSDDAGKSWRRIPGYDFKAGHRVIPDPTDASRVYITTFGSGVWWGPAK